MTNKPIFDITKLERKQADLMSDLSQRLGWVCKACGRRFTTDFKIFYIIPKCPKCGSDKDTVRTRNIIVHERKPNEVLTKENLGFIHRLFQAMFSLK